MPRKSSRSIQRVKYQEDSDQEPDRKRKKTSEDDGWCDGDSDCSFDEAEIEKAAKIEAEEDAAADGKGNFVSDSTQQPAVTTKRPSSRNSNSKAYFTITQPSINLDNKSYTVHKSRLEKQAEKIMVPRGKRLKPREVNFKDLKSMEIRNLTENEQVDITAENLNEKLVAHMLVVKDHPEKKQFVCDLCQKAFKARGDLTEHLRKVSEFGGHKMQVLE